jgi:hypothetical protein
MKKDEPEFEEADWGIDDGWFSGYQGRISGTSGIVQPQEEEEADASDLDLSESARARLGELRRLEQSLSAHRRMLHARIDFIRPQASSSQPIAQQLAYLMRKERALSDQRALLHNEIDQLRGRRQVRKSGDGGSPAP